MANIHRNPKPGTAIKIIVEEHEYLVAFMALVNRKMELDQKYMNDLKALRQSVHPKWTESGISPLVSPFITYIDEEIMHREQANEDIPPQVPELPQNLSLHQPDEVSFDPLEMPASLEAPYLEYERFHNISKAQESVEALRSWKIRLEQSGQPWQVSTLPQSELDYRRAVFKQRQAVEQARKWYMGKLPILLEDHQQRSEEVKTFFRAVFTAHSNLSSNISVSCSKALHSTTTFASTQFIAPRHNEMEEEVLHPLLNSMEYHNYLDGGKLSRPLFGLGKEETLNLIRLLRKDMDVVRMNVILGKEDPNPSQPYIYLLQTRSWMRHAFELERMSVGADLSKTVTTLDLSTRGTVLAAVFLLGEPLIPIRVEDIDKQSAGIPRAKLRVFVESIIMEHRRELLSLAIYLCDGYWCIDGHSTGLLAAWCLSRNTDAQHIFWNIWRKWDAENDCPLPTGVERQWNRRKEGSVLVWKKTRAHYSPPRD